MKNNECTTVSVIEMWVVPQMIEIKIIDALKTLDDIKDTILVLTNRLFSSCLAIIMNYNM